MIELTPIWKQTCRLDARKRHRVDVMASDGIDLSWLRDMVFDKNGHVILLKTRAPMILKLLDMYYGNRKPKYMLTDHIMYIAENDNLEVACLEPVSMGQGTTCPGYVIQEWNKGRRFIEGVDYTYVEPQRWRTIKKTKAERKIDSSPFQLEI